MFVCYRNGYTLGCCSGCSLGTPRRPRGCVVASCYINLIISSYCQKKLSWFWVLIGGVTTTLPLVFSVQCSVFRKQIHGVSPQTPQGTSPLTHIHSPLGKGKQLCCSPLGKVFGLWECQLLILAIRLRYR